MMIPRASDPGRDAYVQQLKARKSNKRSELHPETTPSTQRRNHYLEKKIPKPENHLITLSRPAIQYARQY
jgi:hypothetical protein